MQWTKRLVFDRVRVRVGSEQFQRRRVCKELPWSRSQRCSSWRRCKLRCLCTPTSKSFDHSFVIFFYFFFLFFFYFFFFLFYPILFSFFQSDWESILEKHGL